MGQRLHEFDLALLQGKGVTICPMEVSSSRLPRRLNSAPSWSSSLAIFRDRAGWDKLALGGLVYAGLLYNDGEHVQFFEHGIPPI